MLTCIFASYFPINIRLIKIHFLVSHSFSWRSACASICVVLMSLRRKKENEEMSWLMKYKWKKINPKPLKSLWRLCLYVCVCRPFGIPTSSLWLGLCFFLSTSYNAYGVNKSPFLIFTLGVFVRGWTPNLHSTCWNLLPQPQIGALCDAGRAFLMSFNFCSSDSFFSCFDNPHFADTQYFHSQCLLPVWLYVSAYFETRRTRKHLKE